ncbi:RNI-like protein [Trametes coccinea BRFM310]|uniref:RNI-like protein n=1 Tax=Trametes coccinea (strain BRFM310) TaxID=1353009 RepID=A0A1Y2IVE5_TRAC3|nr:RNI-like protein [Trametes coccinea BRFM310]
MDAFMLSGFNQHVPIRRSSAPKVSLAARSHIESMDAGLASVSGAQEVIKDVLSRRSVTKLILGHNNLGDEGCEELFGFLSSEAGRKYKIGEISLNSNSIGNRGLLAISRYLRDNVALKELFLQNNAFVGDPSVAVVLALAINTSRLETISLSSNSMLGDAFIAHFFPILDAPYLREIQLNVCGLTHDAAPHLVHYLTSPRCQLHVLKLNGNQLRVRGVGSIVRAIHRANYTLHRLELYATGLSSMPDDSEGSSGEEEDSQARIVRWQDVENDLKRSLARNLTLKHAVETDALRLLRYSRVLLLRPKARDIPSAAKAVSPCSESCSCTQLATNSIFSSIGQPYSLSTTPPTSGSHFPFTRLPTELQLHILSFLAPILSNAQRLRIFTYASSPSTLPTLLPCLSNGGCIPDPASPQFTMGGPAAGGFGMSTGITLRKRGGGSVSACANGKCMGAGNSVLCRREAERSQWLASVRCTAFELEDEEVS